MDNLNATAKKLYPGATHISRDGLADWMDVWGDRPKQSSLKHEYPKYEGTDHLGVIYCSSVDGSLSVEGELISIQEA